MLIPAVLFIAYAWHGRARALAETEEMLRRRAAVLAEHVARVFDTHAMMIDFIEAKLEGRTFAEIDADPGIAQMLQDQAKRSALVTALLVLDDDGTVISASLEKAEGLQSANLEYFTDATLGSALHVGARFIGRASNQSVFSLSRQRIGGGVIAAVVRVDYFVSVFEAVAGRQAGDGVVAMFRADGKQLARLPLLAEPITLPPGSSGLMARMPEEKEGSYRTVPVSSKHEHLFGFHQVPGYPVWINNGIDVVSLNAAWLRGLLPQALLSVAASMLLVAASSWILRRARKSEAVNAQLEQVVAERAAEALNAAEARQQALEEAQRAQAAKSHFLAAASHDLRQPIQGLRLFLDVLDQRLVDGNDRNILQLAGKALEGAEDLLSTLLDVSTLEAGMVSANLRPVALAPVITGLACEFAPQAAARGLRLRAEPNSLWAVTDPVLLARVLRNLLTNAVRYTARGGVLIGCRRRRGMAVIQVWDSGPGIPDDKLDAVFEDFVQLGNPERDRAKGLGLGLAVARRMAALMGHKLGVRSLPGRGTMFWVALPIAPPPGARVATSAVQVPISV